jgi:outer membrane protein W
MSIQWHGSQEQEEIEMPFVGNGFNYEIEHFGKLVAKGKKDSDVMPLTESLSIIKTMDQMRDSWGLSYPFE